MNCPQCQSEHLRVVDSRDVEAEPAIRRRRECEACNHRFTTYERVEAPQLWVVKKDGRREAFSREKVARGMWRASEKRPISEATIEASIGRIENSLRCSGETELSAQTVGEAVMEELKTVDQIAYIRFASVYREFADLGELQAEVDSLSNLKQSKQAVPAK